MKNIQYGHWGVVLVALGLGACHQADDRAREIEANKQKIEILKQEAEIQRLQHQNQQQSVGAASEVYQLAASEVGNTLSADAQSKGKSGEVVKGNDGQQYMYDSSTGNWLLYGAIGAAAGYLAANAMNRNKYTPVQKPTAAVERVHKDYRATHPNQMQPPKAQVNRPVAPPMRPSTGGTVNNAATAAPNYRPTQQGYSNHQRPSRGGFRGSRRR